MKNKTKQIRNLGIYKKKSYTLNSFSQLIHKPNIPSTSYVHWREEFLGRKRTVSFPYPLPSFHLFLLSSLLDCPSPVLFTHSSLLLSFSLSLVRSFVPHLIPSHPPTFLVFLFTPSSTFPLLLLLPRSSYISPFPHSPSPHMHTYPSFLLFFSPFHTLLPPSFP